MKHYALSAVCTLFLAGTAQAQIQSPLTSDVTLGPVSYPVSSEPAKSASGTTSAAPSVAAKKPYETYHLTTQEVHPWPQAEGLSVQVQTDRRHIPPVLEVGLGTRSLLNMQADPQRDGQALPVAGAAAALAWERYLNSFKHPIPEYMQERVKSGSDK
ncbi:DUF3613 domain-containing protein [Alcaligenes sp. SDU_A2]|uniref:DUF3613 domain-containing protein n=1 Tax=Alcaligenes sp. SDU_A2 TaxID=3136634 RepID=UPI002C6C0E8B|nr:DUF3613 domain-containing protein [Alcaligenes faecalis]